VLLSLCHTCRYRGIGFLNSRERDIDAFGARRRPLIEVYPKGFTGFTPPHFARLRKKGGQEAELPGEPMELMPPP
jgi:hypothetical protein